MSVNVEASPTDAALVRQAKLRSSFSAHTNYGFREQMEAQLDPDIRHLQNDARNAFGQHRLEATAPWGVSRKTGQEQSRLPAKRWPHRSGALRHAVAGNCWLSVEEDSEPIPLTGGDCFLLARDFDCFARQPRTRPKWSFREIGARANGNVAYCGDGGAPDDHRCGSLSFDRASLKPITQLLPSFILIKAEQVRTLALHTQCERWHLKWQNRRRGLSGCESASRGSVYPDTPGAYRVGDGT